MRLFIAVELPAELLARLEQGLGGARETAPRARWVKGPAMHLTLAFLGEVDPTRAAEVGSSVMEGAASAAPFSLSFRGGGTFGKSATPRVLWLGISQGFAPLEALHASLWRALIPRGFPAERRPFHPHLTLARAKAPRGDPALAAAREALTELDGGTFQVRALTLFDSRLERGGARHVPLLRAPLLGAGS